WYPRYARALYTGFLLLPVLALLGFAEAGREVSRLAAEPAFVPGVVAESRLPSPAQRLALGRVSRGVFWGHLGAIALVLAARGARERRRRRQGLRVTYPDGREVVVPLGFTILDASRYAGIPHASVCGGRGRCSTCRVHVTGGLGELPAPSATERRVLARVGAAGDVRLACQTRPTHEVVVVPLLAPSLAPDASFSADGRQGHEAEIAVLFADLRGFTRMAEPKLPYDV